MAMNIKTWQDRFNKGEFNSRDNDIQIEAGWFDWFCKDSSLTARTQCLGRFIMRLRNSKRVNVDTMTLFLKNCRPASGQPLYDVAAIKDANDEQVFWISFGDVREEAPCALYSPENGYKKPIVIGRSAVLRYLLEQ